MTKAQEKAQAETQALIDGDQPVEPFELAKEGFDVTQPPSETDDLKVDYKKTTMDVAEDPLKPADFDPASNR